MKMKFNKENWSGETGEIDIDEELGSFTYNDIKVFLETPNDDKFVREEFGLESYDIIIDGEKIGSVSKLIEDSFDTFTASFSNSCDLYREDNNKFIAVAKLITNIF